MSKYTTEVRFICENYAGLSQSQGGASVNKIIEDSRTKVFNFDYPIFDEEYRRVLESKILKHYYTREIGFETAGLWQLKLDTKMNEIMPYYNQLYESALLEFNPLYTHDLTRKKDVELNTSDSMTGEQSGESGENGEASSSTTNWDLYSDTPQGGLTGVENETYLTNARKITNSNESDYEISRTNSSNVEQNKEGNSVEDYLERVYGYNGGSASKLLKEYRETFLNIDLMVINELEELFMQLW